MPLWPLGEVGEERETLQPVPLEECLRGDWERAQDCGPLNVVGDVEVGSHAYRCI